MDDINRIVPKKTEITGSDILQEAFSVKPDELDAVTSVVDQWFQRYPLMNEMFAGIYNNTDYPDLFDPSVFKTVLFTAIATMIREEGIDFLYKDYFYMSVFIAEGFLHSMFDNMIEHLGPEHNGEVELE